MEHQIVRVGLSVELVGHRLEGGRIVETGDLGVEFAAADACARSEATLAEQPLEVLGGDAVERDASQRDGVAVELDGFPVAFRLPDRPDEVPGGAVEAVFQGGERFLLFPGGDLAAVDEGAQAHVIEAQHVVCLGFRLDEQVGMGDGVGNLGVHVEACQL